MQSMPPTVTITTVIFRVRMMVIKTIKVSTQKANAEKQLQCLKSFAMKTLEPPQLMVTIIKRQ